jgi:hypothetical protein
MGGGEGERTRGQPHTEGTWLSVRALARARQLDFLQRIDNAEIVDIPAGRAPMIPASAALGP